MAAESSVTYAKVFFPNGDATDWLRGSFVSRDEQGITIRSEDGNDRTFFPFSSIHAIEYERRAA